MGFKVGAHDPNSSHHSCRKTSPSSNVLAISNLFFMFLKSKYFLYAGVFLAGFGKRQVMALKNPCRTSFFFTFRRTTIPCVQCNPNIMQVSANHGPSSMERSNKLNMICQWHVERGTTQLFDCFSKSCMAKYVSPIIGVFSSKRQR